MPFPRSPPLGALLFALYLSIILLFFATPPASALRRSRNAPLFTPNVVYLYNVYGRRVRRQLSPEQFAEFSVLRSRLPCRELECAPVCTLRTINFACPRCVTECAQDRVHARNMDRLREYTWREEQEAEAAERGRRTLAEREGDEHHHEEEGHASGRHEGGGHEEWQDYTGLGRAIHAEKERSNSE